MSQKRRGLNGHPWYRSDRDAWFVTNGKLKVALRDKHGQMVRGEDNEAEALRVWHEMHALADVGRKGDTNDLRTVLELYLVDLEKRATPKTLADYRGFFASFLAKWSGLLVRELKPFHVQQWWAANPTWGASYQNLTGTALKAALNWATQPGKGGAIIPTNPLAGMPLPSVKKRSAKVMVEDSEFRGLLALVKSQSVRDLLTVLWETGTRPGNLSIATAGNLEQGGEAFVFDGHNTPDGSSVHKAFKRTGRALVVPLSDAARDVCLRLAQKHPEGPLFRTARGDAWNKLRIANTVRHYAKRAGLEGRFMAYSCRHSRATTLLEAGLSDGDVAAIIGNTPAQVARTYSHVAARVNRLRDLANKHSPAAKLAE